MPQQVPPQPARGPHLRHSRILPPKARLALSIPCLLLTHLPGKKQFSQLITFLDKGGAKEALRGGSDRDPLRSVKAKREADEAGKNSLSFLMHQPHFYFYFTDVQYRNAVHWCETLRLNREKTIQAGYHVGAC